MKKEITLTESKGSVRSAYNDITGEATFTANLEILEDAIKHLDFAPTTLEDQQRVEGALASVKVCIAELEAEVARLKTPRERDQPGQI